MSNAQPGYAVATGAVKPLPAPDDTGADFGRDFAAAGSYSLYALERMLKSCEDQPNWRLRAQLCAAYYDGKQLTQLQKWACQEEELEERAINLIRPVINSVLGQEAKARTDVRVEADDEDYADCAEVISWKLKEFERETGAHKAISDAYASMVKKGLGWVHVCENADPLLYPWRCEEVPVEEIWWDWLGQRGYSLDERCRWLCRMRMSDIDEVLAAFPQHRAVIERSYEGWDGYLSGGGFLGQPDSFREVFADAFERERRFANLYRKYDWMDTARKMVKLIEVWYRVPATVVVMHLGPTRRVVYDPNDMRHVEAVARGLVKVSKGITSQVRQALYAGPHRLVDRATNLKHFPYVPFFAFRDDADGSPYGLIDGMVAPQDEYNERRLRIQWMLKARQVQMDDDALAEKFNTPAEVAANIMRPDLLVITNKNRRNNKGPAVIVKNDLAIQKEQFEVMQQSEELIQKTAGRFSSSMGQRPSGVTSGVANQLLVEQGEQTMGEMNDNYTSSRRRVFELGVGYIAERYKGENLKVPIGAGKTRRVVILNTWEMPTQPVMVAGPDGPQEVQQPIEGAAPVPKNMVKDAEFITALSDTPNTPAYRQQQQTQIAEIITALASNPQATAVLAPAYIETTNLTNREQIAEDLRTVSGVPQPGDRKARAAMEAKAAQTLAEQEALGKRKLLAETMEEEAKARKTTAEAVKLEQEIRAGKPFREAEQQEHQQQLDREAADAQNDSAFIDGAIADAKKFAGGGGAKP